MKSMNTIHKTVLKQAGAAPRLRTIPVVELHTIGRTSGKRHTTTPIHATAPTFSVPRQKAGNSTATQFVSQPHQPTRHQAESTSDRMTAGITWCGEADVAAVVKSIQGLRRLPDKNRR